MGDMLHCWVALLFIHYTVAVIKHGRGLLSCKRNSRCTIRPIRTLVYENWILIHIKAHKLMANIVAACIATKMHIRLLVLEYQLNRVCFESPKLDIHHKHSHAFICRCTPTDRWNVKTWAIAQHNSHHNIFVNANMYKIDKFKVTLKELTQNRRYLTLWFPLTWEHKLAINCLPSIV